MALSGVFVHGVQAESLVSSLRIEHSNNGKPLSSGGHIHVEASTFAGDTYSLRSQPPANRPREDEDKDSLDKRRDIGDGFGTDYSRSVIL